MPGYPAVSKMSKTYRPFIDVMPTDEENSKFKNFLYEKRFDSFMEQCKASANIGRLTLLKNNLPKDIINGVTKDSCVKKENTMTCKKEFCEECGSEKQTKEEMDEETEKLMDDLEDEEEDFDEDEFDEEDAEEEDEEDEEDCEEEIDNKFSELLDIKLSTKKKGKQDLHFELLALLGDLQIVDLDEDILLKSKIVNYTFNKEHVIHLELETDQKLRYQLCVQKRTKHFNIIYQGWDEVQVEYCVPNTGVYAHNANLAFESLCQFLFQKLE